MDAERKGYKVELGHIEKKRKWKRKHPNTCLRFPLKWLSRNVVRGAML
jgi:hypothetical protein